MKLLHIIYTRGRAELEGIIQLGAYKQTYFIFPQEHFVWSGVMLVQAPSVHSCVWDSACVWWRYQFKCYACVFIIACINFDPLPAWPFMDSAIPRRIALKSISLFRVSLFVSVCVRALLSVFWCLFVLLSVSVFFFF